MTTKMEPLSSGASLTLSPQSPSFAAFSSENIADVAARVVKELKLSHDDPYDDDFYSLLSSNDAFHQNEDDDDYSRKSEVVETVNEDDVEYDDDDEEDEESEFEFAVLGGEDNSSPISADEIFSNGQIKPMFPIFNTDLVYGYSTTTAAQNDGVSERSQKTIRLPLRKLFQERERERGSSSGRNGGVSCSSSEADDLEGVPPGTYCVWTPKKKEEVTMMKKKSKSTGISSKRWRFRDLLYRSNSDGKDTFVFLTPSSPNNNNNNNNNNGNNKFTAGKKTVTIGGKKKSGGNLERKKSYLPYRQDLVGFFANVNGISRTVRPF